MVFRVIGPIFLADEELDGDVTRNGCEFIRGRNGFYITELTKEGNDVINMNREPWNNPFRMLFNVFCFDRLHHIEQTFRGIDPNFIFRVQLKGHEMIHTIHMVTHNMGYTMTLEQISAWCNLRQINLTWLILFIWNSVGQIVGIIPNNQSSVVLEVIGCVWADEFSDRYTNVFWTDRPITTGIHEQGRNGRVIGRHIIHDILISWLFVGPIGKKGLCQLVNVKRVVDPPGFIVSGNIVWNSGYRFFQGLFIRGCYKSFSSEADNGIPLVDGPKQAQIITNRCRLFGDVFTWFGG